MAEVHIIGELVGAEGFSRRTLFCKWAMQAGREWKLIEGADTGQTQVDSPEGLGGAVFGHPIDVHYACKSVSGWPKLVLQVWSQDIHGRNDIVGYGFCHVPAAPGMYRVEVVTWVPEGGALERITAFFVGGSPRLKLDDVVHTPGDRFHLQTRSSGTVTAQLCVIQRDLAKHNIRYA